MIGDVTWKVNGIDLDTDLGAYLVDSTIIRPDVTMRGTSITIPGQHGIVVPGLQTFEAPQVVIGIHWSADDQDTLEEMVNHARALLMQPTVTLTRVSGALETHATAQLVSLSTSDFLVNSSESLLVTYRIPDVFMRSDYATSSDYAFGADITNQSVASLAGSNAPITDAIFRITGPATSVSIVDPLTATGISWAGTTLISGKYLYLCPRPFSARLSSSSSDWDSGGTSEIANADYPSTGRIQLWPVVQTASTRAVLFSASGGGRVVGQTKIAIRARRSYL